MIPFHLLLADFRRLWLGILALMLLIAAACALSMTVTLQERALRTGSARAAEDFDLIIGAPGSETQLVLSSVFLQLSPLPLLSGKYIEELQHDPLVSWVAPLAFGDSYAGNPIVGTTLEMVTNGGKLSPVEGRLFEQETDAVVGARTGLKPGDVIAPLHGQIGQEGAHMHDDIRYTVVGVMPERNTIWDKAILVPVTAVWHVHGLHEEHEEHQEEHENHDTPGVPALLVKPKSIAGAYQLRARYRNGETIAVFPAEVLTRLYTTLGDVRTLLSIIASSTQFLLGISVALVAVVHLNQRKRQIAALRAFGAPRHSIFLLVWGGLMLLVAAGMVLGTGAGYVVARIISASITQKSGFDLPVFLIREDFRTLLIMLAVAAGVLVIPALSVYRQSPARALRD